MCLCSFAQRKTLHCGACCVTYENVGKKADRFICVCACAYNKNAFHRVLD